MTEEQITILKNMGFDEFPTGYFHNDLSFHISSSTPRMRFEHGFYIKENCLSLVIL